MMPRSARPARTRAERDVQARATRRWGSRPPPARSRGPAGSPAPGRRRGTTSSASRWCGATPSSKRVSASRPATWPESSSTIGWKTVRNEGSSASERAVLGRPARRRSTACRGPGSDCRGRGRRAADRCGQGSVAEVQDGGPIGRRRGLHRRLARRAIRCARLLCAFGCGLTGTDTQALPWVKKSAIELRSR